MQLGGRIRRMNLWHLAPVAHSTRVYIGLAVDLRSRVGGNKGLGSGNLGVWVFGTACRTRVIAFAFAANPQLLYLSTAGRSIYSLARTISNPANRGHAGRCRLSICNSHSLPGHLDRLLAGSLHLFQNDTGLFHLIRVHPRQTTHIGSRALPQKNRARLYRGDFWHDFS
ncbi:hypothetical protein BN1708_014471 [Verticillium longisporum]|uniref:Uncharacterized protein n=1 Tax=Verticillium longisporum TaxID=100787 RepID=A0A0G4LW81_VERLO|nr:hypothetical protein BN1708_014471 [Verticillium longisporum]